MFYTTSRDEGTGTVRHHLPRGRKIVNVFTKYLRLNAQEKTDDRPMFIVRYGDLAFFCRSFRASDGARELRAVPGTLRPIATVTPEGVEPHNPVTAFLVTDAPLELECCPRHTGPIKMPEESTVSADLARCAVGV